MNVLLIDDEFIKRFVITNEFERRGHVVFDAIDCQTGYKLLLEKNPDLVILDNKVFKTPDSRITTPEALNLTMKIRSTEGFEEVPIIIQSSRPSPSLLSSIENFSRVEFFVIPDDVNVLCNLATKMTEK